MSAGIVTDEQIRDYVSKHGREPWMGGGPGRGTVSDASIVQVMPSTAAEWKQRIRNEFARLIGLEGSL